MQLTDSSFGVFLVIAAIFGALAVVTGAFGAHALESRLSPERMQTWQTAVQYHFYHTLLLLIIGFFGVYMQQQGAEVRFLNIAAWLCLAGMLIFSGSLYVLCLSGVRWLGAITPIGGLAFIGSWLFLAYGFFMHFLKT